MTDLLTHLGLSQYQTQLQNIGATSIIHLQSIEETDLIDLDMSEWERSSLLSVKPYISQNVYNPFFYSERSCAGGGECS